MDCEDFKGTDNHRHDDIVIAIMGPTGTGKSNLIDTLTGQPDKRVGHGLQSCTAEVNAVRIKNHPQHGDRIVLVDTPGFNDTHKSDFDILEIICKWLVQLWDARVFLSGILYLHRITDPRLTGTHRRTVMVFEELCGKEAAKLVHFVTTMWDDVEDDVGDQREALFKTELWSSILLHGASTARFFNTSESAWKIIESVLVKLPAGNFSLQLQEEIAESKRTLENTKAAKALYPPDTSIEQNPDLDPKTEATEGPLPPPKEDSELDRLADSTRAVLDVLKPWYQMKKSFFTWSFTKSTTISDLAKLFIRAIHFSVLASQDGLALAEKAIDIFSLESRASDEDTRQEYLISALKVAVDGHKLTKKALDDFRTLRANVRKAQANSPAPKKSRQLKESQNNVDQLELLERCVAEYIEWWTHMGYVQGSQKARSEHLGHPLRKQDVSMQWTSLKGEYTQYKEKIQDTYPKIFIQ